MNDWRDQEVRNEALSRDRNEWIEDIHGEMGDHAAVDVYECECGDAACVEHISLTRPAAGRTDVAPGAATCCEGVPHRSRGCP